MTWQRSAAALSRKLRAARRTRRRGRQLQLETLENRHLLATFIVNTTADTVDADLNDGLALDAGGNTSLRAAIMQANFTDEADTIQLGAGTYVLTRAGFNDNNAVNGDLDVLRDLTIVGAGAGATIISASSVNDRIFDVLGGLIQRDTRFHLEGVTLTGGVTNHADQFANRGGAVSLDARTTATILGCHFTGNRAPNGTIRQGGGGAIFSDGNLTIDACRFESNTAGTYGGAVQANATTTTLIVRNSTFANNSAVFGGALRLSRNSVVENSTFVGNVARHPTGGGAQGGAIENLGTLTLTNVTISGNDARSGGGVFSGTGATTRLNHCTVAFNTAQFGGGLHASGGSGTLSLENTIVARNSASDATGGPDVKFTVVSLGYNLIGNTANSSGLGAAGDLLNVDPLLAPLADNGGPTHTHAFLAGSPAGDAANPGSTLTSDQRWLARPRDVNGDGVFRADIGAFEDQTLWPPLAVAGGPYTVFEGGVVQLNAGGSQSRQQDPSLNFEWDFDGDGQFDDAVGATPFFSAAGLEGPGTVAVLVRVTDSMGLFNDGSASINIVNVAPTINGVTLNPSANFVIGREISLQALFSDAGVLDTHAASIDWGDGTSAPGQITESAGSGSAAGSHTYAVGGSYTIRVTVTDDDGAAATWSTSIVVTGPPTASAGGPYTVVEGGSITLDASGSTSEQSDPTLHFAWDLDGDNQFDDATGATPPFSAAGLDGPTSVTVGVRVTDSLGLSSDAFATVTVTNAPPTITGLDLFPPLTVTAGSPVSLTVFFADPGVLDTHGVSVDWGDGATTSASVSETGGSGSGASSHAFTAPGVYTITVTVTDDDGASAVTTCQIEVTGSDLLDNGVLRLIGTQGDDQVSIQRLDDGSLYVAANFLPAGSFTFAPGVVKAIVAHLAGGHDSFLVHRNVNIPIVADGGEGNDHLFGGGRNDILIGGLGADILNGNNGDDILIGGTTSFDANDEALLDLLAEWNSSRKFDSRVKNIRNATGEFLGGTNVRLLHSSTVFDDADADQLTGSAGRDWFFADTSRDSMADRKKDEPINDGNPAAAKSRPKPPKKGRKK
jgi:hypothetical protein